MQRASIQVPTTVRSLPPSPAWADGRAFRVTHLQVHSGSLAVVVTFRTEGVPSSGRGGDECSAFSWLLTAAHGSYGGADGRRAQDSSSTASAAVVPARCPAGEARHPPHAAGECSQRFPPGVVTVRAHPPLECVLRAAPASAQLVAALSIRRRPIPPTPRVGALTNERRGTPKAGRAAATKKQWPTSRRRKDPERFCS